MFVPDIFEPRCQTLDAMHSRVVALIVILDVVTIVLGKIYIGCHADVLISINA